MSDWGYEGVVPEKVDIVDTADMRVAYNCRFKDESGKTLFVGLKSFDREGYLATIPITNTLPTKDGIYTWIIYDDNKFAATRAISFLELGTVHKAIVFKVKPSKIFAAGELAVENGHVTKFNLLSGTYMKEVENQSKIAEAARKLFFGDAKFVDETLISVKALPITKEELEVYKRFGAVVEGHETPEACSQRRRQYYAGKRKTRKRMNLKKRIRKYTRK